MCRKFVISIVAKFTSCLTTKLSYFGFEVLNNSKAKTKKKLIKEHCRQTCQAKHLSYNLSELTIFKDTPIEPKKYEIEPKKKQFFAGTGTPDFECNISIKCNFSFLLT